MKMFNRGRHKKLRYSQFYWSSESLRFRLACTVLLFWGIFLFFLPVPASALEYVHFRHKGQERSEEGRIILESPEQGIALETRDGQLYPIKSEDIISRTSDDVPFEPYTKAEMIERLKKMFPPSEGYYYNLDMYGPFVVVYTTSRAFANRYGVLLKKVAEHYRLFWQNLGVELTEPEFPLVAIVLSSEERYRQFAKQDGVSLAKEQRAYYHKLTNRIVMYDISGQQVFVEGEQRRATAVDTQKLLLQPDNIRTVIHEAIHQVGYNTGMHTRHAPNPVWLCEGLALLHEVPNTRNRDGWTPGTPERPPINALRLAHLRASLGNLRPESIQKMIQDDKLFAKSDTALESYALAWGLTYYLVKKQPQEFAAYLKLLQAKTPLSEDDDSIRIEDFESCFGKDWAKFYREFVNFVKRM